MWDLCPTIGLPTQTELRHANIWQTTVEYRLSFNRFKLIGHQPMTCFGAEIKCVRDHDERSATHE